MKTITLALLSSLLVSAPALAQSPPATSDEPETLVSHHATDSMHVSGWFLAPTFGTTSFGNTLAYSPGLRGGIYLNRRLALGLAFNGIGTKDSAIEDHGVRNMGSYGGLLVQYVVHSNNLIHVSVEATSGTGRWCTRISDGENGRPDGCDGKSFLFFEPMANFELNVARHVRIATGVGYRFAAAEAGNGPSSREMSGLVARTSLVFGSF
jgi:hypothetical protein